MYVYPFTSTSNPLGWLSAQGKTLGVDYVLGFIVTDDGEFAQSELPTLPPAHWRNRGRHEPGDGAYINRYAFSKEGGGGSAHLPSGFSEKRLLVFGGSDSGDYFGGFTVEYWDGERYIQAQAENRYGRPTHLDLRADYYKPGSKPSARADHKISIKQTSYSRWSSYYYSGWSRADIEADIWSHFTTLLHYSFDMPPAGSSTRTLGMFSPVGTPEDLIPEGDPPQLSSEMEVFEDWRHNHRHSRLDTLQAEAYVRAVDSLPHLGMNNIANVVETASLISNMLFSGGLTTIGSVSDAWLAYRYAYNTTKSDIKEMAAMLNRLANLSRNFSITARSVVAEGQWTVRCSIDLHSTALAKIHHVADKWGLALNAYNAWDMVPYSFMVDWFLGVGDALEHGEKTKIAFRCDKPAWFSIERQWTNDAGFREVYYSRFYSRPDLSEAYLYRVVNDASGVTILKRATDALAIVR